MCKVSILVPIYNVEKYLRQCLDSLINQSLKDVEIICINDGSTDNSPDIINEYANKDNRIKVIDKKNTGYGHSMNQGLKLAQGEYIGIVESDDFADLNMFEILYNKAISSQADVIKSNFWQQRNNNKKFIESFRKFTYEQNFSPRIINHDIFYLQPAIWSAIYKHDFIIKNNIYFTETPGASYQDFSFNFKVLACANEVFLIKNALLHYRVDNPNSSVKSKEKVYCIFDEAEEILKFLNLRKDLQNPCRYILESLKYRYYLLNYERVADHFKFDFLNRMYNEFVEDNINGYLNENYWRKDEWQAVQNLVNNKESFFRKKYEELQNARLQLLGFLSSLKTFRKIYIYGAGSVTLNILPSLLNIHIKIESILVSEMENNPTEINNIPVNIIDNVNIDKERDVILISISSETIQSEVFYLLLKLGYNNIILITKELRKGLK